MVSEKEFYNSYIQDGKYHHVISAFKVKLKAGINGRG